MSGEKMTKISGYLEKRGKLTIMGRWKKWWCVLEGQLLLYYKSRIEYANLSPCCGLINMAFVKNVQPQVDFQIHIVTHTQIIILRTKNKEKQHKWFHALVGVLPQNRYLAPLLYFTINPAEYRRKNESKKKKSKHKACEESTTKETDHDETSSFVKSDNDVLNSEASAVTNDSISNFRVFENRTTEIQNISASQEKIQCRTTKISNSLECRLQHSQSDGNSIKCGGGGKVNIRKYASYRSVINDVSVTERIANRRSIPCECIFTEYLTSSVGQYNFLSNCLEQSADGSQSSKIPTAEAGEARKQKRNSRRKPKNDSKMYNTLSKKSFSFLRKIFKKKWEPRNEKPVENNSPQQVEEVEEEKQDSRPMTPLDQEINTSQSFVLQLEKINTIQTSMTEITENDVTAQNEMEEITPHNDLVEQNTTNTSSNNESKSESSDTESDIVAIENTQEDEMLPDFPIKNDTRSLYVNQNFNDLNSNYSVKITSRNNNDAKELIGIDNSASVELDFLLLKLTAMNNQCDKSYESLEFRNNFIEEDKDPDYDIPRPHTSLMSDASTTSNVHEKTQLNFPFSSGISNQTYDSLFNDMAPDSLEMPWLMNDTKCNLDYWSTKKEFDLCLDNDSGSECDYHDSLNSNKYNTLT